MSLRSFLVLLGIVMGGCGGGAAVVADAPKLIPIVGHRFLLPVEPYVVLSVYQSDIIVYGADLRSFLLAELVSLLDLPNGYSWVSPDADTRNVPFWVERDDENQGPYGSILRLSHHLARIAEAQTING